MDEDIHGETLTVSAKTEQPWSSPGNTPFHRVKHEPRQRDLYIFGNEHLKGEA